jgi:hypothetical protein
VCRRCLKPGYSFNDPDAPCRGQKKAKYRGDEATSLALPEIEREKEKMEGWRNLKSLMHEKDKSATKIVNMEARMESEVERHMEVFKGEISTESGAEVMGRLNGKGIRTRVIQTRKTTRRTEVRSQCWMETSRSLVMRSIVRGRTGMAKAAHGRINSTTQSMEIPFRPWTWLI